MNNHTCPKCKVTLVRKKYLSDKHSKFMCHKCGSEYIIKDNKAKKLLQENT